MVQRTYVTFCLWGLAPTSGVASSEDMGTAEANGRSQEREGMGKEQTELTVGVGKGWGREGTSPTYHLCLGCLCKGPIFSRGSRRDQESGESLS